MNRGEIRRIQPDEVILAGDFNISAHPLGYNGFLPVDLELAANSTANSCSQSSIGFTGEEAAKIFPHNRFYTKRTQKFRVMESHETVGDGHYCCVVKTKGDGLNHTVSKITHHHWGQSVKELKQQYPTYHFLSLEDFEDERIFTEPFGLIKELKNDYCLPK